MPCDLTLSIVIVTPSMKLGHSPGFIIFNLIVDIPADIGIAIPVIRLPSGARYVPPFTGDRGRSYF